MNNTSRVLFNLVRMTTVYYFRINQFACKIPLSNFPCKQKAAKFSEVIAAVFITSSAKEYLTNYM